MLLITGNERREVAEVEMDGGKDRIEKFMAAVDEGKRLRQKERWAGSEAEAEKVNNEVDKDIVRKTGHQEPKNGRE